jgi:hypothetical protein
MAIHVFYPEDDEANIDLAKQYGLERMMTRSSAIEAFESAGWSVTIRNAIKARAVPTPTSALLEGAQVDALPVEETVLEWCTIEAR